MTVDLDHLWAPFRVAVTGLLAEAGPSVWAVSGFRSVALQAQLFDEAVRKYGSPAAASKWVAPPGHSNHGPTLDAHGHQPGTFGRALDFGGDLVLVHRLAPKYHIHQAMAWESWHFEPDPAMYADAALVVPDPQEVQIVNTVVDSVAAVPRAQGGGWEFGRRGHVYAFDGAPWYGGWAETNPEHVAAADCVALVPTLTGAGYWLVDTAGEVFSYGDASHPGNYDKAAWGDLPIVGAFTNNRGGKPCGGVTLVRADTDLYRLPL